MNIKTSIFVLSALSILSFSCTKKNVGNCENPSLANKENVQGHWKHNYVLDKNVGYYATPLNYYSVTFKGDSFFIATEFFNDYSNSCGNFDWRAFSVGKFEFNGSMLYLNGIYTDSTFKIGTSNCAMNGAYSKSFKTSFCGTTLKLTDEINYSSVPENSIKLERK